MGSRLFYQASNDITLGADLNWQHIYGKRHSESEFTLTGSDSFTIQGAPIERNTLGGKLQAGVKLSPAVSLKAGYQSRFGNNSKSNGGFASLEVRF